MFRSNYEAIQNEKCTACKFCIWDAERKEYVCEIKGCYNNSKYKLYKLNEAQKA